MHIVQSNIKKLINLLYFCYLTDSNEISDTEKILVIKLS